MKWPEQRPVKELGIEAVRVDRELKRMMGELPDPGPQPPQVITEADVALALEKLRRERAELASRFGEASVELLERKLADYEAVKAAKKEA